MLDNAPQPSSVPPPDSPSDFLRLLSERDLQKLHRPFEGQRVVDLSHELGDGMPIWPGDPAPEFNTVADLENDGYFLRRFTLGEHTGTHINAPAAFHAGGVGLEQYPPSAFVVPAIVMDVRERVVANPDYVMGVNVVLEWERKYGPVPAQCLTILRTGWEDKWADPSVYLGIDAEGVPHFPGFGVEAAGVLLTQRGVAGIGIDTHGVDGGRDSTFSINRRALERPRLVLENLRNLGELPPVGATVVIGVLRLVGGSGSPVSVLAFVPR